MDTFLGIIRSGGTLTARRVRQRVFPDFESREAVVEALADPTLWYEIVDAPQAAGPLLSAWEALGRGSTPDMGEALQTVLDFNKQVIYARDAKGTVQGRQLVALSEDRKLVCFYVYPLDAQKRLGPLFAAYDRQWSAALGLPVYDADKDEEYDIAHILSHEWWDDSAWNLKAE